MENSKLLIISTYKLIGVKINLITLHQTLEIISGWISQKSIGHQIIVSNTHILMECKINHQLKIAINCSDLIIPDGMPLVFFGRLRGFPEATRTDGPSLLLESLSFSNRYSWKHYFYGSTPDVINKLQEKVVNNYPTAQIAGAYSPPFQQQTPDEIQADIDRINAAKPDILWVGLGCPKQEIWIYQHKNQLKVPAILGVGLAFDILAGNKKRAPVWMQKSGLEWLYRFFQEPGRLWKRYLKYNTQFLFFATIEQFEYWWKLLRGKNTSQNNKEAKSTQH
jgi:N-acetylglucosaminyldiphosphoundecaprenol N-acetyl-beta-D-mannosaminyltransferase